MTDNGIDDGGVKALCEMLKVNTSLTYLNLSSVKDDREKKKEIIMKE